MENKILGIHHITAIAGNAKRNYDFYTKVLGLRMVKKTVNFDDPGTYHFYFADEVGTPGSVLTFFPWNRVKKGFHGAGMATDIGYSVPENSLSFWRERFQKLNVPVVSTQTRFGKKSLSFEDPDGLVVTFIENEKDNRKPWTTNEVPESAATRGFHSITLSLRSKEKTAKILTDVFGYSYEGGEGNRHRYVTDAIEGASVVDIVEDSSLPAGVNAGGTIHHVAFRVKDDNILMQYREKVESAGFNITPKIDRNYFFSLYFREPGGVLFEIASDNPGFAVDEAIEELGKNLKLPAQYESHREDIEKLLPSLA